MVGVLVLPDGSEVAARDGLVLGRVTGCDVIVNDSKASRRHAALRVAGSVVEIEDLDSSNGTLLNGKKVQRRVLRDGDRIQIGAWAIAYRERSAVAAKPVDAAEELSFDDEPSPASPPPAPAPVIPATMPAKTPAPVPPAASKPAAAAPPAADTLEFIDEVVQVRPPAPSKPSGAKVGGAARPQPAAAVRDRGVLQFHKQADRHGVFAADMQQMSATKRALLLLFALAVTGAMGYLAMQLVR